MKNTILIFLLFLTSSASWALDSLSLSEAIKTGLANNYDLQIVEKNVEISKNNNSWGMAGALPIVNAGISNANKYEQSGTLESVSGSVVPNISLNWTIFNGFNALISKQKLEHLQDLSEGNAAILVENTIQAIILGYYNVLLEQEKLNVYQTILNLSRDRYRYMLHRKELGSAVTFEVLQEKNNFLADSSNYMLQSLNVARAKRNLNLVLALPENTTYTLTDALKEPEILVDPLTLKSNLENNNRTLFNQYIHQEILKKEVKISRSNLYPTLSVSTGYDNVTRWYDPEPAGFIGQGWDYYANFSLSITLFNGGRIKKSIQNAKINEQIGQITLEQAKHAIHNQFDNVAEFLRIRQQLKALSEARMEAAALNLEIAEDKYKNGTINSFNYRDIQLVYINAAIQNYESIYNLYESFTEIMRLSGNIITMQ